MHLLLLGYSSVTERRVIPAAGGLDAIRAISIASRSRSAPAKWPKRKEFYVDYNAALAESGADLVYISLPNALHETWVEKALAAGKHVIVDKPALTSLAASKRLLAVARRRGLLMAEATVFDRHPHFEALQRFIAEAGPLTHVSAQFVIPQLPIDNFRNHAELGGGCLLDMGPYAAALARVLGGGPAQALSGLSGGRHSETGVDVSFSLLARLANGALVSGNFGFDGEYQNRLTVVMKGGSAAIERVFSPPADYAVTWQQRKANVANEMRFEPADTFARFLDSATEAIAGGGQDRFADALLTDAEFRERLAQAIVPQPAHAEANAD